LFLRVFYVAAMLTPKAVQVLESLQLGGDLACSLVPVTAVAGMSKGRPAALGLQLWFFA
jgi:hypothetical protein